MTQFSNTLRDMQTSIVETIAKRMHVKKSALTGDFDSLVDGGIQAILDIYGTPIVGEPEKLEVLIMVAMQYIMNVFLSACKSAYNDLYHDQGLWAGT